jgi:hypothetical protein
MLRTFETNSQYIARQNERSSLVISHEQDEQSIPSRDPLHPLEVGDVENYHINDKSHNSSINNSINSSKRKHKQHHLKQKSIHRIRNHHDDDENSDGKRINKSDKSYLPTFDDDDNSNDSDSDDASFLISSSLKSIRRMLLDDDDDENDDDNDDYDCDKSQKSFNKHHISNNSFQWNESSPKFKDLNLHDVKTLEEMEAVQPRHGTGIVRCFICWCDNIHLSNRAYRLCAILCTVLIMIVIILVATIITNHPDEDDIIDSPTISPPKQWTHKPTEPYLTTNGHPSISHEFISSLLIHYDILQKETFENRSSPQRKAIQYLIESSLLEKMNYQHTPSWFHEDWTIKPKLRVLVELYVLIVLYYTTNGPSWSSHTNWLVVSSTEAAATITSTVPCEWEGITCENSQRKGKTKEISSSSKTLMVVSSILLSKHNMSGTLPNELQYLLSMKQLDVSENRLEGTLPNILPESIISLKFSNNRFTQTIPANWLNLTNLEALHLSTNELRGTVPLYNGLRVLDLSHNFCSGSILLAPSLTFVSLDNNRFTGSLPFTLPPRLETLTARKNHLKGTLPNYIGQLSNLEVWDVGENSIEGTLDVFRRKLVKLKECRVDHNQFRGTLPSLISLTGLETWEAHNNHLTGTLPPLWHTLEQLTILKLNHNRGLIGTIPNELQQLSHLEVLDLSMTSLSGTFDQSLLKQLKEIHLPSKVNISL